MRKGFIGFLLLLVLFTISCKNKYEFTENAKELEYNKFYSNSISYDGNIYHIYSGKILIGAKSKNSKVTIVNIHYNNDSSIERIEPVKTMILKKDKTYPITMTVTKQNTMKNNSIIEYIKIEQALLLYEGYNVIVDAYDDRG